MPPTILRLSAHTSFLSALSVTILLETPSLLISEANVSTSRASSGLKVGRLLPRHASSLAGPTPSASKFSASTVNHILQYQRQCSGNLGQSCKQSLVPRMPWPFLIRDLASLRPLCAVKPSRNKKNS